MAKTVYVRDAKGKPKKASLIRPVNVKRGFGNLALVLNDDDGLFSVTELRTGASIGGTHFSEEDAIFWAKDRLSDKTVKNFRAGIRQVVDEFGELPAVKP